MSATDVVLFPIWAALVIAWIYGLVEAVRAPSRFWPGGPWQKFDSIVIIFLFAGFGSIAFFVLWNPKIREARALASANDPDVEPLRGAYDKPWD